MSALSTRKENVLKLAVRLVLEENLSLRAAVSRTFQEMQCRIDKSTLSRRLKVHRAGPNAPKKLLGRPPVLTRQQEKELADTCLYFSLRGVPLILTEVAQLVSFAYGILPSVSSRFKNGLPGRDWLASFFKRHGLSLKKPSRQDAVRFRSTNADTLTSHLVTFEELLRTFSTDPTRLFNLDETGMSPEKDCDGNSNKKVVGAKGKRCHTRGADFESNLSRVSLLGCVSAAGEAVLPLWIYKGKRFPFRVRLMPDGSQQAESAAHLLPPGSLHGTRPEVGGVDTKIFVSWCEHFVRHVENLTRDGKKVLLVYDAHRAHMSLECLLILKRGNVEAYAIPAHTSGVTQPLDVGVFSSFKKEISNYLLTLTTSAAGPVSLYDMCTSFNHAYNVSFTRQNILSGFSKSGLWPFRPESLLCRPLPASKEDIDTVVDAASLIEMMNKKRRSRRTNSERDNISIRSGFIDTTHGTLLTTEEAISAIREKERKAREKNLSVAQRRVHRQIQQQKKADSIFEIRTNASMFIQKLRAKRFGVQLDQMPKLRSLSLRRAVARARTIDRRHAQSSSDGSQ